MQNNVFDLIKIAGAKENHVPKPDLNNFTHVRAYHCCRPVDQHSYRDKGILVGQPGELESQFREIFNDFDEALLDQAVAKSPPSAELRVDLALDYRWLFRQCQEYAQYGSERLLKFADNLNSGNGIDLRGRLRDIGTPTMVIAEVPIKRVDKTDLEELDELLLQLANGQYKAVFESDEMIDFTISIDDGVPPDWIAEIKTLNDENDQLSVTAT